MRKRRWLVAGVLLILLVAGGIAYWFDLLPLPDVEDGDYPLRPIVLSEVKDPLWGNPYLYSDQTAWWRGEKHKNVIWVAKDTDWKTEPYPQVKAYPKLESGRPLYGAIDFTNWRIDPDKPSAYFFVVDESRGTGKGYDRLYFDLNHDGDLTNDRPTTWLEQPISLSQPPKEGEIVTIDFPPLAIPFDFGPDDGMMPVEIFPRLSYSNAYTKGQLQMCYLIKEGREGTIRMGRHRFQAIIHQDHMISGRYDSPSTELHLLTTGFYRQATWQRWWGDEELSAMRLVDGKLYSLSVSPTGDTLHVRRYRGELGILRIGPGNRQITEVGMSGSLASEKHAGVPIGRLPCADDYYLWDVRECEVPVGDYCPRQLSFHYGHLAVSLSNNYHTDGKRHGADEKSIVYAIKIRKDRPFVLDFSNRPESDVCRSGQGPDVQVGR